MVQVMISFGAHISNHCGFGLKRNTVQIGSSTEATGSRQDCITGSNTGNNEVLKSVMIQYVDSPSTTSSTTYQATVANRDGHTFNLNRTYSNNDASYTFFGISTITLTEIAG